MSKICVDMEDYGYWEVDVVYKPFAPHFVWEASTNCGVREYGASGENLNEALKMLMAQIKAFYRMDLE